jgi:methionyl-tRNA formyltransferase
MKIIFAGTPEFAIPSLQTLIASHHEVIGVYTQPDRPAGRGRRLRPSPIKQLALASQLVVRQPASLGAAEQVAMENWHPDLMIVVAYGHLIPSAFLQIPKWGCINLHASLLPRWRGAAPIHRAILAGDRKTGISLMQMEASLDTGPILYQATCEILPEDTSYTLQARLAKLGAEALIKALANLPGLQVQATIQDHTKCCYAEKIKKTEALLNWSNSAEQLVRQIQAFNPWPTAFSFVGQKRLLIQAATQIEASGIYSKEIACIMNRETTLPGTIIFIDARGMIVKTGQGYLCITQLQIEGARSLSVSALLNAKPLWLKVGTRLG